MSWSTSAPSLPSGSSWSSVGSASHTSNNYSATVAVHIARLATNQVGIRFVLTASDGSYNVYYPPGYADFSVGNDTKRVAWGKSLTWYWTGTLNSGATVTVKAGGSNSSAYDNATFLSKTATGPAYVTTYTVAYNANGGSGAPSSQTKTYGTALTLSATVPTRTGYAFTGWNTKSDGSGTSYSSGGDYTANASVTLYAQWQIITYTVSYNGNGSTGGSTASQTKTYGTALTLRSNGFTRTNYTFTGWNTASDGSGTSYAAGASYTKNAALTLYAIWKKNNIPVYINDSGTIRQVEKAYININGTIKECTVYLNVNGVIKTIT